MWGRNASSTGRAGGTATTTHERDLRHSEEPFRLSFTHAPFAMALISLDGRYEQVNPAMCALTGYTEAALIGLSIVDITHPDDVADDLAAVAALLAGERDSVLLEKRYLTPGGDIIWAAKSATLMRREDGAPQYIISQLKDISARKIEERTLMERHRQLEQAESIGRVGSWEWDLSTKVTTWSAGLFRLIGVDPATFTGDLDESLSYIHAGDIGAVRAGFITCARTGAEQQMRYRITRANDGVCRWMDARGGAVYEDGRVVRIVGVVADVTEQVEAEQSAASARSFQQAIMTASPDLMFVYDLVSRSSVWVSRSITAELGYTDEQAQAMNGDPAARLVPPEVRAQLDAAWTTARNAATDDAAELDFALLHADGTRRWFARRIAPLHRDEHGAVTQVVGVLRDTTASVDAQNALRESETRFRQLADNVDVAFTLRSWEPDEFLYVSLGYERILGYNPMTLDESPTKSLHRIYHEDRDRFMTDYWAVCRAGQPAQIEYRLVRPDGEIRWMRATSSPVVAPEGAPQRSAAIVADINDARLGEAALLAVQRAESASAAKNEFLGRMSHELRTPMNAILGFAQLLEMDAEPGTQLDAVQHILSGGRHLVSLIDDVLDIANIEGDRLEVDVEAVSISKLMVETTTLMSPLAAAAQVTLVYEPAGDSEYLVRADARRLRQVLLNLLSNAIKYNHPGGRVDVRCELPAGAPDTDQFADDRAAQLDVVVSDTGFGIRDEDLPRLFTPFDRLGVQARGIEGTGVGLALSLRLMSMMGGGLRATSQFGVGSRFIATLIRTGSEVDGSEPTNLESTGSGEALVTHGATSTGPGHLPATVTDPPPNTLLYIEDVDSNIELMESLIHRRPRWQMIVAGYGRLGHELASSTRPDLVLLDVDLLDQPGIEVLHGLRADVATSQLRVVMVGADANPSHIERMTQAGADGYLTKPLVVGEILQLLDSHDPTALSLASAGNA